MYLIEAGTPYQVLQIAVTVMRSFGCESSLTKLGADVVANERPKPSIKRLTTNMGKLTLSHWRTEPIIMMMLPTVIPHLRPYLSATHGAIGVEQILPSDMMALISPSLEPRGLPKKSSQ